ncbi:unnamed protein product [Sphenostylis stenocarpa]|uniref:Uncharacterized protein n=1 Tax=Sphenostylis stenocarpa TaxID=92480 RepID=A0AA86T6H5_9FABA|nr:unnamed protein product [Sphenostylis stenocarpa]
MSLELLLALLLDFARECKRLSVGEFDELQAITLFRALASNPDIRSIDICRAGKKVVWSRNSVTEGFR